MGTKNKILKLDRSKIITLILLAIMSAIALIYYFYAMNPNVSFSGEGGEKLVFGKQISTSDDGILTVHFIDVGQGESIFIEFPDGKNMLIDGGFPERGADVVDYIADLGVSKIDAVLATHSDNDHVGGLPLVFNKFDVAYCFRPMIYYSGNIDFASNFNMQSKGRNSYYCETKDYRSFLWAVVSEKCGWSFFNFESDFSQKFNYANNEYSYTFDFLTPTADVSRITYYGANDYSPICLLKYGDFSLMLTGDAAEKAEKEFLANYEGEYPDVDVLKVGHHGSSSSTSEDFAKAINPEYAVISCGKNNEFGHPHRETLRTLADCWIVRTDELGTIKLEVTCDNKITFTPSPFATF